MILVPVIKQLVKCLRTINQPVLVEELLQACNIKVKGKLLKELKVELETILDTGVDYGYLKKCNGHYYSSTHENDMVAMLDSSFDAYPPDAKPDELLIKLFNPALKCTDYNNASYNAASHDEDVDMFGPREPDALLLKFFNPRPMCTDGGYGNCDMLGPRQPEDFSNMLYDSASSESSVDSDSD